jgi:hypothetical protein
LDIWTFLSEQGIDPVCLFHLTEIYNWTVVSIIRIVSRNEKVHSFVLFLYGPDPLSATRGGCLFSSDEETTVMVLVAISGGLP